MYSSLSSSAEINEVMDRKEIHALVKSIILEDVSPIFIDMLRESEKRIDSTNSMVQQLAESITKNQDMSISLLKSMEKYQENISELIKANMELTKVMELNREDFRFTMQGYKDELQSAKQMYRRVSEAYMRMAEGKVKDSGSSKSQTDVNISM